MADLVERDPATGREVGRSFGSGALYRVGCERVCVRCERVDGMSEKAGGIGWALRVSRCYSPLLVEPDNRTGYVDRLCAECWSEVEGSESELRAIKLGGGRVPK